MENNEIQFNENLQPSPVEEKKSSIIQWVIKISNGKIKNKTQANYVLLGFVFVVIVVAIFLTISSGSNQPTSGEIPVDQIIPQ
jgi:hypothetical protein